MPPCLNNNNTTPPSILTDQITDNGDDTFRKDDGELIKTIASNWNNSSNYYPSSSIYDIRFFIVPSRLQITWKHMTNFKGKNEKNNFLNKRRKCLNLQQAVLASPLIPPPTTPYRESGIRHPSINLLDGHHKLLSLPQAVSVHHFSTSIHPNSNPNTCCSYQFSQLIKIQMSLLLHWRFTSFLRKNW